MGINAETVTNITSTDFPGHHTGEDLAWSIEKFDKALKVQFHKNDPLEACFSVIGVDASIANAFRRILLAEVPTLAIEQCYFVNNTSVIADEVLAHRLGLIPLKGDRDGLKFLKWFIKPNPEAGIEGMDNTDYNTVILKLQIQCERNQDAPANATEPEQKYIHSNVYAKDIVWEPVGQQIEMFKNGPIEPVNPDILIAKLRPGQEIDITMHAILGKGSDHAKWSPVGTASYRLLPKIDILKPILGMDARKFQKCFPPGVIELSRVSPQDVASGNPDFQGREGDEKAVVKDPMRDTVSRECLRHDEFTGKVRLGRVQDHFIFNVESTGQFHSDFLFLESVKVLKYKAKRLLRALDELES